MNHVCLGIVNIDPEIDSGIALMAYGLNPLKALSQSSACHAEEHLHWSLPTWLPDMGGEELVGAWGK